MFTIYLDDMMEDYDAINSKGKLPTRKVARRDPTTGNKELLMYIAQKQKHDTPGNIQQYLTKLTRRHEQTTKKHDIQQQETPSNEEIRNIMEKQQKKTKQSDENSK